MFHKVLVANRGAVAARVIRALRALGVRSAAVYSEADRDAPYLDEADEAHLIGPAPARESYLNQEAILKALAESRADALHPGYGFLAENPDFALRVEGEGAAFVGPSPRFIEEMGHKTSARDLLARHGMPVARGSGVLPPDDAGQALIEARRIGFPVLVKPAAGGGGIGMLPARDKDELMAALDRARSMAERSFANGEVYLETLIERPRHVEFQVLGDRHGNLVHLFERDCSLQRRNQKIIEESPAPALPPAEVERVAGAAAAALRGLGYDNIGTVETLRGEDGSFGFLEVNTRLQVEHGVTEAITGIDLVAAQVRAAAGERLADILPAAPRRSGHAIEARIYAEDPRRFFPSPGPLKVFRLPDAATVRVETGYREGMDVTPHYDPLLAKVIAHGATRDLARTRLIAALRSVAIEGVKTNVAFLVRALASEEFAAGAVHTGLVPELQKRG